MLIDVDQAPPRLAQSWDSVGLVRRPRRRVDSVTVAVDATPAVVDQAPGRLLLRTTRYCVVDTVAANAKAGVLVHRLTGRSLLLRTPPTRRRRACLTCAGTLLV